MIDVPTIVYEVHRIGKVSRKTVLNTKQAAKLALNYIPDDGREYFVVFLISALGTILGVHIVSIGTASWCDSRPVEVFRPALLTAGCDRVIVAHNHPSGGTRLSATDKMASKMLRRAGNLLGIALVDYIVVSHHMPGTGKPGYKAAW